MKAPARTRTKPTTAYAVSTPISAPRARNIPTRVQTTAVTAATSRISPTAAQVMAWAARSTESSLIFVETCSRPSAMRVEMRGFCSDIVTRSLVAHGFGNSALWPVLNERAVPEHKAEPILDAVAEVEPEVDDRLVALEVGAYDEDVNYPLWKFVC